ncbi:hypothetical protein N0B31_08590 [Salinirubellus salinus]|uniref:Uncharacterized protein n=1 Tax=Salinirubellus salinus TaxID=1364945 RepID=A0A9E7U9V3_9EURY|nr:hypothetical protein [Salinirubellus salinus]UWM56341.1 hypothetical protein N0B31_08590 [Salinirubellus salinus]
MPSLIVPRPPTHLDRFLGAVATLSLVAGAVAVLLDAPLGVLVALGGYGFAVHTVLWLSVVGRRGVVTDRSRWVGPLLGLATLLSAGGTVAVAAVEWGYLQGWGQRPLVVLGVGVLLALFVLAAETLPSLPARLGDASETGRLVLLTLHVGYATLAVGVYATVAAALGLPAPVSTRPAVAHLLLGGIAVPCAAGLVALAPSAYGRSLPRPLVAVALPAAAFGPPLVALGLPAGVLARVGATLEAVALGALLVALVYTALTAAARPAGTGSLVFGLLFGSGMLLLGGAFSRFTLVADVVPVEYRLAALGFLGLALLSGTRYALRRALLPLGSVVTLLVTVGLLVELAAGRLGLPSEVGQGVVLLAVVIYAADVGRTLTGRETVA